MASLAELSSVPSWFAVFPDSAAAGAIRAALAPLPACVVDYPSARPWLVGNWPPDTITTGQAGDTKIAVIGQHAITACELSAEAGRVRRPADLNRLARSLQGSSHVIASIAGTVRVQGTVTGVRRVFTARLNGIEVAADRADLLARLLESSVDEQRLAVHLLHPPIVYPLAGQPVWRGVELLPTDHCLVLDRDGGKRAVRWWSPPEPVVPLAEGAVALWEALVAAVGTRTRNRPIVSCDLGGVDSTAVCSLAACGGQAKTVAYTAASLDPLADDVDWAKRTVAALGIEHHVIPAEQMPLVYDGLLGADDVLDEPCAATVDRNRWLVIAHQAAARGSRLHLTGIDGDELLYGSLAHLHPLPRSDPRTALRNLRGFAAKYRWPRRKVWRQLRDNSPYSQWLRRVADSITTAPPAPDEPLLDWGFTPRLPAWASTDAIHTVQNAIYDTARNAGPLAQNRGQHREMETMRFISRIARQLDQMARGVGIGLGAPYYDDRVVEAGLAVRPQDRISPWQYKPLLAAAMHGIVPPASLTRSTKANGTCDDEAGLQLHRGELLDLCAGSRLAELGLVDEAALREACTRAVPTELHAFLYETVACETWLRSLEKTTGVRMTHG
ncbi:asparagine synthase-related protein [Kibdelosporangium aridum]|uniref:asparagine synthase-related protein n=1 Tax=Kibdelosporangium aridum TaxID=2030 RepID=UPI000525A736